MSYANQPPTRPATVNLAAVVLLFMAVVGFGYAVATIVSTPGTVSRFRANAAGAAGTDVDNYVSVVWIGAAIGTVLAIIAVALFVVLAMGLRRGSNPARIATLVFCGLGLVAGLGSALTVAAQRSGSGDPRSLGAALSDAYPASWIGLNIGLSVAQVVGYLIVGALLLLARGPWFGHPVRANQPGTSTPYSYGYQPVADQAYPPAGGQPWVPGTQSVTGQFPSPGSAATPSAPPSFGVPPMAPTQPPYGPPPAPPNSSDDEYWSRPSS